MERVREIENYVIYVISFGKNNYYKSILKMNITIKKDPLEEESKKNENECKGRVLKNCKLSTLFG